MSVARTGRSDTQGQFKSYIFICINLHKNLHKLFLWVFFFKGSLIISKRKASLNKGNVGDKHVRDSPLQTSPPCQHDRRVKPTTVAVCDKRAVVALCDKSTAVATCDNRASVGEVHGEESLTCLSPSRSFVKITFLLLMTTQCSLYMC